MSACRRVRTLALAMVVAGWSAQATAQSTTDIVIEWNRILQTTLGMPGALPPTVFFTRPYAVLHVAIFDALNSIDYRYREQIVHARVHEAATSEVAAAQAAHDVMVAMFPTRSATFDAALAGLTPTPYHSGQSQREQGISKAGSKRRRWLMVELAWGWLHWQPDSQLSQWYQERFGHGSARRRKLGIVALARKLLVRCWAMLRTGQPWRAEAAPAAG